MKWIPILFGLMALMSCGKGGGNAPSTDFGVSLSILPTSLIVPKSISTNIQVINTNSVGATDVTTKSTCVSSNPIASISAAGQVSNTYTGTAIQLANITCTYNGQSVKIPMTIVPAVLQNLVVTKRGLSMAPGTSQAIQVYGNFLDSLSPYVFALDMTNYVTWSSTSGPVATAAAGTVSANGVGLATLTASFISKSVSTDVTVSNGVGTSAVPKGVGLTGSYYDFTGGPWSNSTIGDPFQTLFGARIDSQVYFNWSTGTNNLGQVAYFGIRWTGRIYIPTTGSYTFYTLSDDGIRMWVNDVNGNPVIDNWTLHGNVEDTSVPVVLTGGQYYNVKIEYFENAGYSQAELWWSGPGITKALVPQVNLFPQ